MSHPSIAEHFSQYFQLTIADTPKLKKEVFKIRYKVYCEELNYESTSKFPDGLEMDDYDDNSIHILLKHRLKGVYAGCVRLVLAESDENVNSFPLEKIFPNHFSDTQTYRSNCCEVSRLAVPAEFRKRKDESTIPEGIIFSPPETSQNKRGQRQFPVIALSLYWAAFSISVTLNLDVLALMEPRLARHLKRTGIISQRVSDLIDYRGKRGLFLIQTTKLISTLDLDIYQLFSVIHTDLQQQLNLDNENELLSRHLLVANKN